MTTKKIKNIHDLDCIKVYGATVQKNFANFCEISGFTIQGIGSRVLEGIPVDEDEIEGVNTDLESILSAAQDNNYQLIDQLLIATYGFGLETTIRESGGDFVGFITESIHADDDDDCEQANYFFNHLTDKKVTDEELANANSFFNCLCEKTPDEIMTQLFKDIDRHAVVARRQEIRKSLAPTQEPSL